MQTFYNITKRKKKIAMGGNLNVLFCKCVTHISYFTNMAKTLNLDFGLFFWVIALGNTFKDNN